MNYLICDSNCLRKFNLCDYKMLVERVYCYCFNKTYSSLLGSEAENSEVFPDLEKVGVSNRLIRLVIWILIFKKPC